MIGKIALLALLAVAARGQELGVGPCPDVRVVQDFNVSAYLGLWHQIERTPNPFEKGACSTALYGPVENGLVLVHNTEIRNGNESSVDGTAELANPNSTEAKLIVKFFNPDSVAPYWVLGTDYENYSLVYSCENVLELFHIQFSWILGRQKPLSEEALNAVNDLIAENGLDRTIYETHDLPECVTSS